MKRKDRNPERFQSSSCTKKHLPQPSAQTTIHSKNMASTMEVDHLKPEAEKTVSVHPLAIVNMADQYTRITCGGSQLPVDAPVVGLLFGFMSEDSGNLQVLDADDIPTDRSDAAKTQVALHHAVFPQYEVVGWYRVSAVDDQPNEEDLRLTEELKRHYPSTIFLFSLLQVPNSNSMVEDDNTDLPLSLYESKIMEDGASVLIGLDDSWSLETSEPERIAVERVVREQPQQEFKSDSSLSTPSPYVNHMGSVQQSLSAMNDRVQILIEYLERTEKGEIPPNHSLLRQVRGLILQLGPLAASTPHDSADESLVYSHLAAMAKTVHAVQGYTEKFRVLFESRPLPGRETRRF